MGKSQTYYDQIVHMLKDFKKTYPTTTLGQHLSIALEDYKNLWFVSDKEILYALEKYNLEIEIHLARSQFDVPSCDEDIEKIIKDAQNLDKLFTEEEEEDYE